jgi:drug/metabolite transporter (DMT)-like permease
MYKDYFKLHFIILLWGFTAITGKWISIDASALVWYRTLLAAFGVGILLYFRSVSIVIDKIAIVKMLATGGLVATHWFCFFEAARISTVSICLIGLATTAFWTSLLEPLIVRRAWKTYELLLGLIMVAAMALISHFEAKYFAGLLLGVVSALCASLFTIINGQLTQKHNHFAITFYEMVGAWLATTIFVALLYFRGDNIQALPMGDPNTSLAAAYLQDGLNLFFLAIVCTVYAYSASVELMRRIPPFAVNLSVNLEPVYGIALAALFFSEWKEMTIEFYFAGLVILLCVFAYPFIQRWAESRRILNKV